jgi:hypothetical protein
MFIYRIQDADGFGPYQSSKVIRDIYDHHNEIAYDPDSRTPSPYCEGLGPVEEFHRFGFASLEQLDRWFTAEEQAALFREGFELVVLEVPDYAVRVGQHQCKFIREDLCTL